MMNGESQSDSAGVRIVVVVTGGASGIGFAIAQVFGSKGAHVAILDVNVLAGAEAVEKLQSEFPRASFSFFKCNVASWEDQSAAFRDIYNVRGRIDVVAANAGIGRETSLLATFEEVPQKPTLDSVDINLIGTIYTIKLAVHYMIKSSQAVKATSGLSRGTIICTASNAGIYAFPVAPLYAAAKAAVVNLVRSLAQPLEKEHIQINALAPAVIETNIASNKALFSNMIMTPMSTLKAAVERFIDDPLLTGCVAEVHGIMVTLRDAPPYVDEATESNIKKFWALGHT